jgi:protein TonB
MAQEEKRPRAATVSSIVEHKIKRDHNASEQRKLFFSLGLVVSLSLVLLAFEWKTGQDYQVIDLGTVEVEFEELQYIPVTTQSTPKPPKVVTEQVIIVTEETPAEVELDIDLEPEVTEEPVIEELVFEYAPQEEVSDEIFEIVEKQAEPAIGMSEFYQYVSSNLVYPEAAKAAGVEGKVYLQFVVDQQGGISQVTTLKGLGFGCDQEAIRVMESSPKWIPARQQGRPVKSKVTLPLVFKLS